MSSLCRARRLDSPALFRYRRTLRLLNVLLFPSRKRHARINGMHNEASSRVKATITDSHFLIPLGVFFVGLVLLIMLR